MADYSTHEQLLQRALDLARQGVGLASPNPYVGAVIVDAQGSVAGEGIYTYAGVKHAEVLALEQAGETARGGTLYINLEPHSHQGRTPPCTDALIAVGIRRVVASMPDPNPKVSGSGFEKLRAAGIEVEVGQLSEEARRLNENFARYIRHGIPLVTLKSAMTLDGKIAPSSGVGVSTAVTVSKEPGIPAGGWITGESARAHVHEQRHQSDAIVVGVGTVISDDPLLTDRSGRRRRRPLLRVILDSHLRVPLDSRIVQTAPEDSSRDASSKESSIKEGSSKNDVLIFCSSLDQRKKAALEARGVRVEQLPAAANGRPDLHAIFRRLAELEITSVMIEGGATINATALASDAVDKVFFYYAPKIMGDGSVPFANIETQEMQTGIKIKSVRLHRFEDDIAIEGYLRDPYQD